MIAGITCDRLADLVRALKQADVTYSIPDNWRDLWKRGERACFDAAAPGALALVMGIVGPATVETALDRPFTDLYDGLAPATARTTIHEWDCCSVGAILVVANDSDSDTTVDHWPTPVTGARHLLRRNAATPDQHWAVLGLQAALYALIKINDYGLLDIASPSPWRAHLHAARAIHDAHLAPLTTSPALTR